MIFNLRVFFHLWWSGNIWIVLVERYVDVCFSLGFFLNTPLLPLPAMGFFFIWGLTQGWGGNGMKKHVKKGVKG
jgi:hypothetical protein